MFGGNWVFVFHRTSVEPLGADDVLSGPQSGFHAFVDFIWAKREKRILRLRSCVPPEPFHSSGYLKAANVRTGMASFWFIYDMNFKEIKRTSKLTETEACYPQWSRIDDAIMAERVDREWRPEQDPRIDGRPPN